MKALKNDRKSGKKRQNLSFTCKDWKTSLEKEKCIPHSFTWHSAHLE